MILSVTLNPSVDRTLFVDGLKPHDANRVQGVETDAGGKGLNLSRIARRVGAETCAIAFLGGSTGDLIQSVLQREGVALHAVRVSGENRLNVTVEDRTGAPPTSFNERGPQITAEKWAEFLTAFEKLAHGAEWVSIGGSMPPGVGPEAYADLVDRAHAANCLVGVDADGDALKLAIERKPDLIKPNREEAARFLGAPIGDAKDALSKARAFYASGVRYALISLGADGAVLCGPTGAFLGISPSVQAVSTIGAGDSLLGAFLARLVAGDSPEIALRWGLAAGAATALTSGAQIGNRENIERLFDAARVERSD